MGFECAKLTFFSNRENNGRRTSRLFSFYAKKLPFAIELVV